MTPTTRLGTDIEVHVDDTWWPGTLEHWRQRDDRWEGWVRYSTGVGQTRIGWYARERIRKAEHPKARSFSEASLS